MIVFWGLILCTFQALILLHRSKVWMINTPATFDEPIEMPKPQDVTFILGKDENKGNPYYQQAITYYRTHPEEGTEQIVTHCQSLLEVRNYLEAYWDGKQPWGTINMVVHSNEWFGMGVPIVPGGYRSTPGSLQQALDSTWIQPLDDVIVDSKTEVVIYGCGLGQNQEILNLVSQVLGGTGIDQERPIVRSSKYFVLYQSDEHNPFNSRKFLAQYWYAFYRTGYRPGDIRLSKQLTERYPNSKIDWRDALSRTEPTDAALPYNYVFSLPLNWTVTYASEKERPILDTKVKQQQWLLEQPELQEAIAEFGVPMDKFRWQFETLDYTFKDGVTEPAIHVKGKTTILCILKPLVERDSTNGNDVVPFMPDLEDDYYYATVNPEQC